MPNTLWKSGTSGDWTLATNWLHNTAPTSASNVIISVAPATPGTPYIVSLSDHEKVKALTLSQAAATLALNGTTLTVASTFKLSTGTLSLLGSTLTGASAQLPLTVAAAAAATLSLGDRFGSNTLSNLVWDGAMNLVEAPNDDPYQPEVTLRNVTFAGANGSGTGQLSIGTSITVTLDATSLANVDASLGANSDLSSAPSGTLTIAANASITDSAYLAFLTSDTAIVNAGHITVSNGASLSTARPYSFTLPTFTNSGTVSVSDASLVITSANITNTGLVAIGAGGYAELGWFLNATLANPGTITVAATGTLSIADQLTTAQIPTFGVTAGTFGIAGTLTNTGATLSAGTGPNAAAAHLLLDGGQIIGGTIVTNNAFAFDTGTAIASYPLDTGTLTGVAFQGPLVLDNAKLTTNGGFTLAGSTPTLSLSNNATLMLADSLTLNNAIISLGGTLNSSTIDLTGGYDTVSNSLVFGPNTQLTLTGLASFQANSTTDSFTNQGTITATLPGISFNADGLTNTGHIVLSNSAVLAGVASNSGTIAVLSSGDVFGDDYYFSGTTTGLNNTGLITESQTGATLTIAGGLTNTGTVAVSNGATLALSGDQLFNTGTISVTRATLLASDIAASQLDTIKLAASTVDITDSLTIDTAAPLRVGAGTALGSVKLSAEIVGGQIIDTGNGIVFVGNSTLSDVAYQGAINITRPLTTLTVRDGLVATSGPAGTAPGIINLTGAGTELLWEGTGSLDNATLSIGNASLSYDGQATPAPTFIAAGYYGTPTTLGPHLTIAHTATYATIGAAYDQDGYSTALGTITSAATIHATLAGGHLSLEGAAFTSTGAITITTGDTVTIGATAFTNAGAIIIGAASTLALDTFNYFASATFADTQFTNTGTIALYNGTLTELTAGGAFPDLPILNTGTIRGAGLLDTQINNAGAIVASGGTLTLDQSITGTGRLIVGTGATLNLAATGAGQRVTFGGPSGTLGLSPPIFHAKLVAFVSGDAIDLAHTAATSAAFAGDSISITLSSGGIISLATTSALSGSLTTLSDAHGGTLIEFAGAAHAATPLKPAPPVWATSPHPDVIVPWTGVVHVHAQ